MKSTFIAAAILVICTAATAGQHQPGADGGKNRQDFGGDKPGGQQRMMKSPAMQKLEAARTLTLTPDQQSRLTALETQARKEMQALREEMKPQVQDKAGGGFNTRGGGFGGHGGGLANRGDSDRREMMQKLMPKMQAIGKEVSDGIDAILTPDQKVQLNEKLRQSQGGGTFANAGFGKHQPGERRFGDVSSGLRAGGPASAGQPGASAISPPSTAKPTSPPSPPAHPADAQTTGGLSAVNPFTP
jgi:Spy/CpxP family protein refolding chaperone